MRRSYRLARRSFLASLGGAFGLQAMLRNLEASAQGQPPPPRLFVMHWPLGTVRYHYLPEGSGSTYTTSRILQPFEDAGLREDMIGLYGLSLYGIESGCGGGAEAGTVMVMTGTDVPGTRENGGEADDAVAGGPSFDQVFSNNVTALQTTGPGYANAIADARVDSLETSAQCLSYGYEQRVVAAARAGTECTVGGELTEAVPHLPTLSPFDLYTSLFGGFMPGQDDEALRLALLRRKSVLDYSIDELERMKTLAPASEAPRIDAHAEIVRGVEQALSEQLAPDGSVVCGVPGTPDPSLVGEQGSQFDYGYEATSEPDDPLHAQVGAAHTSIIRAAFQCDLIRVATFQWAPGNSHVSFGGLFPDDPDGNYMHNPLSHRVSSASYVQDSPPSDAYMAAVVEYLANVHTWYNTETAAILSSFKDSVDVFGANLLEYTIVPFVTETANAVHSWSPMPALIFGGRALGMQGGQFLNFEEAGTRPHNDFWMSIASALLQTNDPLAALASEVFVKDGVAPIEGLWMPP